MTWRARPAALGRLVAALILGALLILLAGSGRQAFLSPGPLTFQHAGLKDCGTCHSTFDKGVTAWVRAAFSEKSDIEDSERCLACHDLGINKFTPHNLSLTRLGALTREVNVTSPTLQPFLTASTAATIFTLSYTNGDALACATCHQEHNGKAFDLAAMTNAQCQVCHVFQFANLSTGHPEFFGYPFKRRTRIVFDHASHFGKHFIKPEIRESAPRECAACHKVHTDGRTMRIKPFKESCATCHVGQIMGAGRATAKGLAVFGVPGLDVATLAERGVAIGDWPEDADEELTPWMDFLLAGSEGYASIRKTWAEVDLLDLADATDSQIASVAEMAWRIKILLFDIAVEGIPSLKARLKAALGRDLDTGEIADLMGLLPVDAVRAAQQRWFPDLGREITTHRAGRPLPQPAASVNDSGETPSGNGKDGEGLLAGDKDGGLLNGDKEGEGLLAGDKDGGDLLSGDGGKEDAASDKGPGGEGGGANEPGNLATGEDWSAAGGWYRDEETLRYRPTGHADRFIKAWLDIGGRNGPKSSKAAGRQILETLADAKSSGLCGKCHSIDAGANDTLEVNWRGRRLAPREHQFTVFSHSSHFSLLGEEGCLTCHEPKDDAKYSVSFKDRDSTTFDGNFWTIERGVCAKCHTQAEAGDGCLTCHNFHIGIFRPTDIHMMKMTPAIAGQFPGQKEKQGN